VKLNPLSLRQLRYSLPSTTPRPFSRKALGPPLFKVLECTLEALKRTFKGDEEDFGRAQVDPGFA